MPPDTDVTVVGTGNMGSALAGALLTAGHSVTVWNRTPERHEALRARGARGAPSLAEALRASEVIIICVLDYDVSHGLLDSEAASAASAGKNLVQLTTGSA